MGFFPKGRYFWPGAFMFIIVYEAVLFSTSGFILVPGLVGVIVLLIFWSLIYETGQWVRRKVRGAPASNPQVT